MRYEVTVTTIGNDGRSVWHYSHVEDVAGSDSPGEAFADLRRRVLERTEEAARSIEAQADGMLREVAEATERGPGNTAGGRART